MQHSWFATSDLAGAEELITPFLQKYGSNYFNILRAENGPAEEFIFRSKPGHFLLT